MSSGDEDNAKERGLDLTEEPAPASETNPDVCTLYITADEFLCTQRNSTKGRVLSIRRESGACRVTTLASRPHGSLERTVHALMGILHRQQEAFLVVIVDARKVATIAGGRIFGISRVELLPFTLYAKKDQKSRSDAVAKEIKATEQYFSKGFYYSPDYDLTRSWLSPSSVSEMTQDSSVDKFFFNKELSLDFLGLGQLGTSWICPVVQGFVASEQVSSPPFDVPQVPVGTPFTLTAITRNSRERIHPPGAVGLGEDGEAAEYAELELIIEFANIRAAYLSARGSWPVVWQRPPRSGMDCQVAGHAVSTLALAQHARSLLGAHGHVLLLSLLQAQGEDRGLRAAFEKAFEEARAQLGEDGRRIRTLAGSVTRALQPGGVSQMLSESSRALVPLCSIRRTAAAGRSGVKVEEQTQRIVLRVHCAAVEEADAVLLAVARDAVENLLAGLGMDGDAPPTSQRAGGGGAEAWERAFARLGGKEVPAAGSRERSKMSWGSFAEGFGKALISPFQADGSESGRGGPPAGVVRLRTHGEAAHRAWKVHGAMCEAEEAVWKKAELKLCVVSWNANAKIPKVEEVKELLLQSSQDDDPAWGPGIPSMIVVGLQEAVELGAASVLADTGHAWLGALKDAADEDGGEVSGRSAVKEWQQLLEEGVRAVAATETGREVKYELIASRQLVGVMVFVYAERRVAASLKDVSVDAAKTGLGGMAGNKGGVAVRMSCGAATLCFVCAHLAAHTKHIAQRNSDYAQIMSNISFSGGHPPLYPRRAKDLVEAPRPWLAPDVLGHDSVFFLGDLNYRLDGADAETLLAMIEQRKLELLYPHDQLLREHKAGRVLWGFQEGTVEFLPTYKFKPGTDNYSDGGKGRAPAWCDRVLWRGRGVSLVRYKSSKTVRASDHKPAIALFRVALRTQPVPDGIDAALTAASDAAAAALAAPWTQRAGGGKPALPKPAPTDSSSRQGADAQAPPPPTQIAPAAAAAGSGNEGVEEGGEGAGVAGWVTFEEEEGADGEEDAAAAGEPQNLIDFDDGAAAAAASAAADPLSALFSSPAAPAAATPASDLNALFSSPATPAPATPAVPTPQPQAAAAGASTPGGTPGVNDDLLGLDFFAASQPAAAPAPAAAAQEPTPKVERAGSGLKVGSAAGAAMMSKVMDGMSLTSDKVATGASQVGKLGQVMLGGGAMAAVKGKEVAGKAKDAFADLMTDFKFPTPKKPGAP